MINHIDRLSYLRSVERFLVLNETAIPRSLNDSRTFPRPMERYGTCSNSTSGFQRNRGIQNQFRRSQNETAFRFIHCPVTASNGFPRWMQRFKSLKPRGFGWPNAHHYWNPHANLYSGWLYNAAAVRTIDGSAWVGGELRHPGPHQDHEFRGHYALWKPGFGTRIRGGWRDQA